MAVEKEPGRRAYVIRAGLVLSGCVVLTGCVMAEKYEAEKARSLNFQRLLAQEEKRTTELDSEVKRAKKELAEMEARNRELTAQIDAVRDQMAHLQEEAEAMKEAALLEKRAAEDMKRMTPPPTSKPKKPESIFGSTDLGVGPAAGLDEGLDRPAADHHVVRPGDTLFRISRMYHVTVDQLKAWNNLSSNFIEVGQKLIVSDQSR